VRDKNGKIHTQVVRSARIVTRTVLHNITHAETVTTPGATQIITTRVPVIHIQKQVVTINGRPVTVAETVTRVQTQTLAVTQTLNNTQTVTNTKTITNSHAVTVTKTQTLPPATVTATKTTTVTQTQTLPPATVTATKTTTVTHTTTVVTTVTGPPGK
jgi:hypothetical protein